MNTRIEYLYRDACNYKVWQEVILAGEITEEDKHKIADSLEEETYFIPEQLGLPLRREWAITEDDHCFCELCPEEAFALTEDAATDDRNIHELAEEFEQVKSWAAEIYAVDPYTSRW